MHSFRNKLYFNKRTETFRLTIDCLLKQMEDKVKNLGVIFDSRLSFDCHIISLSSWLNRTVLSKMYRLGGETDSAMRCCKRTGVTPTRGTEEAGC